MTEKKLLLLDLDNTLWDFDANAEAALSELFHRHHLHIRSAYKVHEFVELYKIVNATFWRRYEKGEINKEFLRTERFTETFIQMGIPENEHPENIWKEYLEICPIMTRLIPGAFSLLERANKLVKIGLVTNGFDTTQKLKIKHSGIDQFISFMITSESLGIAKPHAAIFENALKMGVSEASKSLYIGDIWDTDVVGATNAGIPTIWFNRENQFEQGVGLSNAKILLDTVHDLDTATARIEQWAVI